MHHDWRPTLGAWPEPGGVRFRVWAPDARALSVVFEPPRLRPVALEKFPDGTFGKLVRGVEVGDRYRYELDGGTALPDPASRFQPEGVHGPSEVVDPSGFVWSDSAWRGLPRSDLVLYELHIGAFTPEGTFGSATGRLPYLAQLGVTAVELMPLADFPGRRNWG